MELVFDQDLANWAVWQADLFTDAVLDCLKLKNGIFQDDKRHNNLMTDMIYYILCPDKSSLAAVNYVLDTYKKLDPDLKKRIICQIDKKVKYTLIFNIFDKGSKLNLKQYQNELTDFLRDKPWQKYKDNYFNYEVFTHPREKLVAKITAYNTAYKYNQKMILTRSYINLHNSNYIYSFETVKSGVELQYDTSTPRDKQILKECLSDLKNTTCLVPIEIHKLF